MHTSTEIPPRPLAPPARRANRIAVIETLSETGLTYDADVSQWSPDVDEEACVDDWSRTVASALLTGAQQTGFNLLWHYWHRDETAEDIAHALFPHAADAALILTPGDKHEPLITILRQMQVPFVLAFARRPEPDIPWVVCNNKQGIAEAVRHLVSLGHRRLGFLGGPQASSDIQERAQGFREAVADAGLTADPSLVVDSLLGEAPEDVMPAAFHLLRSSARPTALVCASDLIAIAAMEAAWQIGLSVPQDLALTGFDDLELAAHVFPRLTTIHQPVREIAATACYLAACAAVGERAPATGAWRVELPVALVIRESCGAKPASDQHPDLQTADQHARHKIELRMRQLTAINQEMSKILSVISHDLRSPLVTIQGFAATLERKHANALDENARTCLARIRASTDSLAQLLDELLAVSRSHNRPLNFSQVNIPELIDSVLGDLAAPISQANAQVIIAPDMPPVMADPVRLRQVFTNLIANALKYNGHQPHPEIRIGHAHRADEHEFFVQDNGIGIPPEHHERIFELFWRAPEHRADGAGIGLSVAKAIILRHGGRIWVESDQGAGATFRFTLPRKEHLI